MTEAELQDAIADYARIIGYTVAHFSTAISPRGQHITPVKYDAKGFPDLVLVRPPRLIFVELKSAKGTVSPDQKWWLDRLDGCPGAEVYQWRPADWPNNVTRILPPHTAQEVPPCD